MPNTSRLTIDAEAATIAQLAGEALHRRQMATCLTLVCTDSKPNRTVLKLAAEGIASRIVAAQLPFFVVPEKLHAGLTELGISTSDADAVIGKLGAAMAIREEREQVNDAHAAELLVSYLVGQQSTGCALRGINARPTSEPSREPAPTPYGKHVTSAPEYCNPQGYGRPPSSAAIRESKADYAYALAEYNAVQAGKSAAVARAEAHQARDAAWAAS